MSGSLVCVMLDAVLLEHDRARIKVADDTMTQLLDCCEELRTKAAEDPPKLSPAAHAGCLAALDAHHPSAQASTHVAGPAERQLLNALRASQRPDFVPSAPHAASDTVATMAEAPLRVVSLANALDSLRHQGRVAVREATHCSFFVSHLASEGAERKVAVLCSFLCTHPLLAQLTVTLLLLSVFLLPLGSAIASFDPHAWRASESGNHSARGNQSAPPASPPSTAALFPIWSLSAAALGLLALAWLWVLLSQALGQYAPRRLLPWAHSPDTLWLAQCCVDHSSPAAVAAANSYIGRYLAASGA